MAVNSNLEWTDATWNPIVGCTKYSDGCANCYAAPILVCTKVLFVLNSHEKLGELADIRYDKIGLLLDTAKLPKRVRPTKKPKVKRLEY